jgi:APA family basic amino acid/polyamine antiporter
LSLIFAGIIAILTSLSFASLGSKITKEGGEYQFVYTAFGKDVGFFAGLLWIAATAIAGVTVSIAFAGYLTRLVPFAPMNVVAAMACIMFMIVDVIGLRFSSRVNSAFVVVKVGVLILFIALTLPHFNAQNIGNVLSEGGNGIFTAAFLIFFAYAGFGKITAASEEVKDATRTIPKAIIIAISIATVLYILTAVSSIGAVGAGTLSSPAFKNAPLASVMLALGMNWGFLVILVGALAATSSVLLIQMLGLSRTIYAMSVNRQLPAFLSRLHPRFKTPYLAEIPIGLLMAAVALLLRTKTIIMITSFGMLGYYAIINLAALQLKKKKGTFNVPNFIPILGFVLCALLIAFSVYGLIPS